MRSFIAALMILFAGLAGCVGSDDEPTTVEAAAAETAPAEAEAAPPAVLDPETGAPVPADRVRMVEWRGELNPQPGLFAQLLVPHVRIGPIAEEYQSDAFVGRLAAGTLTLAWEDKYDSLLELRILVGTRTAGWSELARVSGSSPVVLEWPTEETASDETRQVQLRVYSADRGAGPLEVRAPSAASFSVDGALVVDGEWTAPTVR